MKLIIFVSLIVALLINSVCYGELWWDAVYTDSGEVYLGIIDTTGTDVMVKQYDGSIRVIKKEDVSSYNRRLIPPYLRSGFSNYETLQGISPATINQQSVTNSLSVRYKDPGVAALWSFAIPGAGYFYVGDNKEYGKGVLHFTMALFSTVTITNPNSTNYKTMIAIFGVTNYVLSIVGAYRAAKRHNNQEPRVRR